MGHDADAREIAIAKHEELRRSGRLSRLGRASNWFLGKTIRHGYNTWRVVRLIGAFLVAGFVVFGFADYNNAMRPSKEGVYLDACYTQGQDGCVGRGWRSVEQWYPRVAELRLPEDYPRFNLFVYSLDTFFPIVGLHQESFWLPSAEAPGGWLYRLYLWVHIGFGWLLTTLGVLSLTGIVRRD